MKKYLLTIMIVTSTLFGAYSKKEVNVYFNPAKLTTEKKGDAVLFKYNVPKCHYVEQEPGAPVLPAVLVYVLMPKNAVYKSCAVRAQSQPVRGQHKIYCRKYIGDIAFSASRYPSKLVEFVKMKDIKKYRIFIFRTFPVSCQPGDGSVNRILQATLDIKYYTPGNIELYKYAGNHNTKLLKHLVVNPDDMEKLTETKSFNVASSVNPSSINRDSLTRKMFATKINKKNKNNDSSKFVVPIGKNPNVSLSPKRSALEKIVEDSLFIDDNDIVYAPISF